jgi:hypothetical protein
MGTLSKTGEDVPDFKKKPEPYVLELAVALVTCECTWSKCTGHFERGTGSFLRNFIKPLSSQHIILEIECILSGQQM